MDADLLEKLFRKYYDYVEKNGAMSYGCLVTGTPEGLLSVPEEGIISTLVDGSMN